MKPFWQSKIFWANVLGVGYIVAEAYGFIPTDVGTPENQVIILGAINILLRIITRESITW